MIPRRGLIAFSTCAVVVVVIVGTIQATRRSVAPAPRVLSVTEIRAALAGSPPILAALHEQGSQLLAGGAAALHARLRALRGHPVVVNKWASWCIPCATEFPVLARVAASVGREVGFLGIDSGDPQGAGFLRTHPVSYPSYLDRSGALGTNITLSTYFPVTVFYDARGQRTFIHQGGFNSVADLKRDIARYARPA
jgi:cytochrome c biogenesis protein CcmG/thiol:disulfide interchange protein DsbE